MQTRFSTFVARLCCSRANDYEPISEKTLNNPNFSYQQGYVKNEILTAESSSMLANKAILALISGDDHPLRSINRQLSSNSVRATSWAEGLAQGILDRLVDALQPGNPIGDALRDTYNFVRDAALRAFQFAKDHPVLMTIVIALGILVLIAPWVVHVLGFTEEGILAGSWAARWQSTYGGFIEEGSLFSWLQSFGALH